MLKIVFYYTKYSFIDPGIIGSNQFYQLKSDEKLYRKLTKYKHTPISKYIITLLSLLAFPVFTVISLSSSKSIGGLLDLAILISLYFFICGLYSFPSLFLFWADKKYHYKKLKSDFVNSASYEEFKVLQKSSSIYQKEDLEMIDNTYKKLTNKDLQILYLEKHTLQTASLNLFETEYKIRSLHIGLPFSKENNPFKYANSNSDFKTIVISLLKVGESIENIKIYLSEFGRDLTKNMLQ